MVDGRDIRGKFSPRIEEERRQSRKSPENGWGRRKPSNESREIHIQGKKQRKTNALKKIGKRDGRDPSLNEKRRLDHNTQHRTRLSSNKSPRNSTPKGKRALKSKIGCQSGNNRALKGTLEKVSLQAQGRSSVKGTAIKSKSWATFNAVRTNKKKLYNAATNVVAEKAGTCHVPNQPHFCTQSGWADSSNNHWGGGEKDAILPRARRISCFQRRGTEKETKDNDERSLSTSSSALEERGT